MNGRMAPPFAPTPRDSRISFALSGALRFTYTLFLQVRTALPDDLILVHEFGDHYSLQARKEMTVEELNAKINAFLTSKGQRFTKEEWLQRYPQATE
ncbi:hypothetical protein BJX99DRAFT_265873 [Aspergillus californicus]